MSSFKEQIVSGVLYTAIAKYSGIIVQLVVAGILGRILSPQDFGTVAIVTVIITFFSIFCDIGIAPAIIQKKELGKPDLQSIFSFTLWLGIVLSFIFYLSSWSVASFYGDMNLVLLCHVLTFQLLFTAWNIVPNALLYRDKRFGFIAGRTFAVQFFTGLAAVVVALLGAGIYALLVNPILSAVAIFIINMFQYPMKMRLKFSMEPLGKIFSYSFYQFLFNIFLYFSRNLDKLLIGKYMSAQLLGYYEKSYRMMMLPLQNLTFVISPVLHPVLSDFQNDFEKLDKSYLKVVKLLAIIGFPLSVFLFFNAREIMLIVFGQQWELSVMPFKILSLSVGFQILVSTTGPIFQAANSTKYLFVSGLLSTVLNVAGIVVGLLVFGTLEAIAGCIVVTFIINFFQAYLLLYCAVLKRSIVGIVKIFARALLLSLCLAVVMWLVSLIPMNCGLLLSLLAKTLLFIVVVIPYVQITGEYDLFDIMRKLKSRLIKK
jgi:O-antigen/teichoic acid export membrane protein